MHTPTQSPAVTPAHTPGPWKVVADPQHAGKHPFHDNRWIMTADAEIEFGHDPRSWDISRGTIICQMRDHISAPEANARLIAASPELLAALESVMQWTEGDLEAPASLDCETIVERITFIKSAIARATGKGGEK